MTSTSEDAMHEHPMEIVQRRYARGAGFMYLLNYATSVFGALTPPRIAGSGTFSERAARVLASEHLYRAALASMTVGWVVIVLLAFALYVTLKPVNARVALLALCLELGQASVGAVTVMFSFATLHLYAAVRPTPLLHDEQLQALVRVFTTAGLSGFNISMMFLAAGSTLFFSLFYRSGYIPRALAGLGVVGSVVLGLASLASLIWPDHAATLLAYGWGPIGIAEVATAFWLAIAGIRLPPPRGGERAAGMSNPAPSSGAGCRVSPHP